MTRLLKKAFERLRSLGRREDGNTTIEFVFLFPFFIIIFVSAFESGMLMLRQVMLERAVDDSVRGLRLGTWTPPTHAQLKTQICDLAAIIPDCDNTILIELQPVNTTTWQPLSTNPTCVDRSEAIQPVTTFEAGQENEMMLVRVCAVFKPLFPHSGLGLRLPKDGNGDYSLVSTTAFVNEPRQGS